MGSPLHSQTRLAGTQRGTCAMLTNTKALYAFAVFFAMLLMGSLVKGFENEQKNGDGQLKTDETEESQELVAAKSVLKKEASTSDGESGFQATEALLADETEESQDLVAAKSVLKKEASASDGEYGSGKE